MSANLSVDQIQGNVVGLAYMGKSFFSFGKLIRKYKDVVLAQGGLKLVDSGSIQEYRGECLVVDTNVRFHELPDVASFDNLTSAAGTTINHRSSFKEMSPIDNVFALKTQILADRTIIYKYYKVIVLQQGGRKTKAKYTKSTKIYTGCDGIKRCIYLKGSKRYVKKRDSKTGKMIYREIRK